MDSEAPDSPGHDEEALASDAAVREAEAFAPGEEPGASPSPGRQAGRIARSTAFFSVATAASRIAGLVREVVAASYYGVYGPMSAFTIAFQVPNLVRALFADAALQPAFVPIFSEQLERKNYREAFRLASTLLLLVTLVLGAITALFVLTASFVMPLFAPGFEGEILDLTITLSQVLFPILILLGISGVVVGILNSYDRFGAFAISPLFWNLTIILVVVLLAPAFHGQDRIYAYAIGILIGTLVQLLIPTFDLRNTPFKFEWSFEWRNPDVRRVLLLMLPVTISLGLINFNLLINSFFGSLVSEQSPAAIDKAFRIYQLPQGIFSVAIATVLFPTLARFASRGELENLRATMANGMRQILFVLVPAAAAVLVLSEPMIRLVYQRGEFTPEQTVLVATALFWFAFSLPTNGLYLLQTRTFFSLQRPWMATGLAALDLVVSALAALALYKPFGTGGIVAGTGIGTTAAVVAQAVVLRNEFGGLELRRLMGTATKITIAAAALAAVSFGVWDVLDNALGRGLAGQIISLGAGLGLGGLTYLVAAKLMRIAELEQITRLLRRR
ncbi:MAG: putative peptidoglycan lipid flippase [Solirubrobacterales bacterium]|jgi:putative peptidoglycan lipid II flippase|nr:putative peptidoglycan lipid flippase [Solirubrobacterales bacterium]